MMSKGFLRHEAEGVVYYSCPAFDEVPRLRHAFTTRMGPEGPFDLTARSGLSPAQVERNRLLLLDVLGLSGDRMITLSQTHSDIVWTIDPEADAPDRSREGDALAVRAPGLALAVQVADCFPILLVDRHSGSVAAVHSGWRGTAARILQKTVTQMVKAIGANPASIMAAIGPGIRSCCMQVGPEVARRFEQEYSGRGLTSPQTGCEGKYLLDLPAALSIQCAEAGIPPGRVFDSSLCTRCRTDEFFSYRGEGASAGRMMGIIGFSERD